MLPLSLAVSLACIAVAVANPVNTTSDSRVSPRKIGKRCTGTIASLADVAAAQECTTINIAGFTVPAGQTFSLSPPDGAVVSMTGQITFPFAAWAGPLMKISGNDITFNGNNHNLDGQGAQYWDGLGGSGGVEKPAPMITLEMSGTFENVQVLNSPQRAVAINTNGLTVSGVTVNNAAGAASNSLSNGKPAGANTDVGVLLALTSISTDDCLAINRGSNITFTGNSCTGGHGISISNISAGFNHNQQVRPYLCHVIYLTLYRSGNALRIKTDATATGSTVSNVVYSGNKATGTTGFGVLIDQSYPAVLGTPGTGVVISDISFTGTNTIAVGSTGHRVEVNCGSTSSCTGTWNFAGLTATGGTGSTVKNAPVTGGSF
ncbi:glycoside hydrolase [Mycena galopus ATCC 62051]|nr:glycoside hydrolase [Mycena galopus ATCC 62051]